MNPLMAFERRWLRAVLDTIFPGPSRGGSLPLGAADLDVDRFFDDMFAQVPFESALGLRAAMWFLALSPLVVIGRFTTFDRLSVDDRERVYLKLAASPVYVVRSLVIALKAIGSLLYCSNAVVRPLILGTGAAPSAPKLVPLRAAPSRRIDGHRVEPRAPSPSPRRASSIDEKDAAHAVT